MIRHLTIATLSTLLLSSISGCQSQSQGQAPSASETQPTAVEGQTASNEQPATKEQNVSKEVAMFGAGCFWGVEARFRKIEGVTATEVGYAGGNDPEVTYKEVCTDTTGHAEVVKVTFDPQQVSYRELLNVFFSTHDPTQVNRQGPDVGKQYRSVIFYTTPEQQQIATEVRAEVDQSDKFSRPIATEITAEKNYCKAEEYHQQYLAKRGQDSCSTTIGH
jgi:peptide-methionine (S)-S-oxide reductase